MKLLLTGSAGRIGQAIRAALEPSHSLIGLDRLVGLHTDCVADISDRAAVRRALVDVDAIEAMPTTAATCSMTDRKFFARTRPP